MTSTSTRTFDALGPYLNKPSQLSPTRGELGGRCHRRHVLSDFLHLHADYKPSPLSFGDVFHQARAAFWRACLDDDGREMDGARPEALTTARELGHEVWDVADDGSYHTKELFDLLMEEYAKNATLGGIIPGDWRMVQIEERLRYEQDGMVITFQLDSLLENEEGELCIMDAKTASRLSKLWRDGQRRGIQIRAYKQMIQEVLGQPVRYVQVEGVQKKTTPGLVDYVWADADWTPAYEEEAMEFLRRRAVEDRGFLEAMDSEGLEERWMEGLEIALTEPLIVDFNLMDCESYYTKCPYYELCHSCPTERMGLALSDYQMEVRPYAMEEA